MGNLALNIAASGINAAQAAMDTVAENLSNANTAGYISESPNIVTNADHTYLGTGTGVTSLPDTQNTDELLQINAQQASGAQAQASSLQQVLTGVESSFPVSTSVGFNDDLSNFWNSWDAIGENAQSGDAQVVANAQTLASDLNTASAQLTTASNDAQSQLGSLVTQDNQTLTQVATLNKQILAAEGAGESTNSLVDQQNALMNQLASDLGAVGTTQSNGTLSVAIGSVNVVSGQTAQSLQVTGTTPSLSLTTVSGGTTVPATSGTASGLLAAVNQYLPGYQSQLDTVANDLATTVNTQLEAGYTASGSAGTALFQGNGAAGITVNPAIVADPTQLAVSDSATNSAANTNNAQTIANLYNSATGPDKAYQTLVQTMGSQISGVNSQVETATSVANAAQQNLESVSGVDTNTQLVMMLNYQQQYQASAKVLSTADSMVQSLLQAV